MKTPAFLCLLLIACQIHVFGMNLNKASSAQLDAELFRRLETAKGDPSEVAFEVIRRSGGKASIYLVNAYTVLGIVHKNKGYYVSALQDYLQALDAAEALKDNGRISAALNNIGIIYVLQENYPKAIDYFNKSLKLEEKLQNPLQKSIRLFNLGDCYYKSKQYEEALGFYTSSLLIERKEKNREGIVYAQLGLAGVYIQTNRLNDAQSTLASVDLKFADPEAEVLSLKLQGEYALALGDSEVALNFLKKAAETSIQKDVKSELAPVYWLIAGIGDKTGNASLAAEYYRKYSELNRQLQSNLVKNQLEDLAYQHELERKQLEIKYLHKQRKLAEKNAQTLETLRSFDWRIAWFSSLALVALIIVVFLGVKKLSGR